MELMSQLAIVVFLSAIIGLSATFAMEWWLEKRRIWLLQHAHEAFSQQIEDEEVKECDEFLKLILTYKHLDRQTRAQFVSGFIGRNYKAVAEAYRRMLEGDEDEEVAKLLEKPLWDLGVHPLTYTTLQSFFAYLSKEFYQIERIGPPEPLNLSLQINRGIKRILDLVFSLVLIPLYLPLMLVTGLILWIQSPAPVWYTMKLLGEEAQVFNFRRFRTGFLGITGGLSEMDFDWVEYINGLHQQKSYLGKMMIALHLYNLPLLINIIVGEMSFVGPRPISVYEWSLITRFRRIEDLAELLTVKPGVVGPGILKTFESGEIDADEVMDADLEYVRSWSIKQDIIFLLKGGVVFLHHLFLFVVDSISALLPLMRGRFDLLGWPRRLARDRPDNHTRLTA